MSNTFEGTGKPKIIFRGGEFHIFSEEPNGIERGDLRQYDFQQSVKASYWSENDKYIEIGKKFIFSCVFKWKTIPKKDLRAMWKAESEPWFIIILNEDKEAIQFKVRGKVRYNSFEGLADSAGGYTVQFEMTGVEKLDKPGYGVLGEVSGYGTNWGTQNQ